MIVSNDEPAYRATVYIILSHRNPEQIHRLAKAVLTSSPTARVLLYHDCRHSEPPHIEDGRVTVVRHTNASDWGSWEIVQKTVDAFRKARDLFDPGMVVLMSGQDYPVRNLADWEQKFLADGGGWMGTSWPLTYAPRWGKPYGEGNDELTRYIYRWFRLPFSRTLTISKRQPAVATRWVLDRIGHYFEPLVDVRVVARGRGYHVGIRSVRTPFSAASPCFRGSQWIALDRNLLAATLNRHDHDRLLRANYQHSIIPDESYFQTILTPLAPPAPGPALTYVEWLIEDDAPRVLTLADLDDILASGSPLCRKVEAGPSDALLDRLDELSTERPDN